MTIAEIKGGEAVRVTDYWGKPFDTPDWREEMTDQLDMPADGRWPSDDRLSHRSVEAAGLRESPTSRDTPWAMSA